MVDSRKVTKDFINHICDWVEWEYRNKNHDGFIENLDNKLAYLVADKNIEKRIQNQLFKRLKLKSTVQYEFYPVICKWKLYIKLLN